VFAACGIGAGHEHQPKRHGRLSSHGPHRQLPMQALRQGSHPGAELAWAVADQHNGRVRRSEWLQVHRIQGTAELRHTLASIGEWINADGET
jgi:hypothetical protein